MKRIANRKGDVLLDFAEYNESDIMKSKNYVPTASFVVAEYKGKVLLAFDSYKNHWELPGGKIEKGESPRRCAVRELAEETCQHSSEMKLVGEIVFQTGNGPVEYATVYSVSLDAVSPFSPNEEISAIAYWDFQSDIGYIDEISGFLAATVLKRKRK